MKFAIINDIHIGDYRQNKGIHRKGTIHAERLLNEFVDNMNGAFKPDFVVQGGDMVQDTNLNTDKNNFIKGFNILSRLDCPVYHIIGNHDLKNLNEKFLKNILGYKKLYYYIDNDNFRFIFLFPKQSHRTKIIQIDHLQLRWLKTKVKTEKKIIIFSHYSLAPVDTTENFWFNEKPELTFIKNYKDFLKIIDGKNIKLAFNFHLHWNKKMVLNGVNYITVQSLVENTSGEVEGPPANAYTLVEIDDQLAKIEILGDGGLNYKIGI